MTNRRCSECTYYALFASIDGKTAWCGDHAPVGREEFRLITDRRSPVWEYRCVHGLSMTSECDDCEGVGA